MKKILFLIFFFSYFLFFEFVYADVIDNAKSGILIDASSGNILFEKEKNKKVSVASMTKMVSQIIILENVENGNLDWDEKISISSNASGMGGSQIYLQTGEKMSVRDLMKGISMASANDATVALAERIAGSEENFVKQMNAKVKEIGLKNTVFKNCTGLDENGHYSTAYDMALIAKELLSHEEILKFSSIYEDYLRENTSNKFWLVNTNKLVRFYEGADGLKTGFTDNAGYCIAVTAKRDNMRLIAIVLGEKNGTVRNNEAMQLLDYGFNQYKVDLVNKKNDVVKKIYLDNSNKKVINIYPKEDIVLIRKKSDLSLRYDIDVVLDDINLPLKKNSIIGKIHVKGSDNTLLKIDAVIRENVDKISFFSKFLNSFIDVISGNIL